MQNKPEYKVNVKQAPEMHEGVYLMPNQALFASNTTIAAAFTLGMQNYLNLAILRKFDHKISVRPQPNVSTDPNSPSKWACVSTP
jgi:hypothetical protein